MCVCVYVAREGTGFYQRTRYLAFWNIYKIENWLGREAMNRERMRGQCAHSSVVGMEGTLESQLLRTTVKSPSPAVQGQWKTVSHRQEASELAAS